MLVDLSWEIIALFIAFCIGVYSLKGTQGKSIFKGYLFVFAIFFVMVPFILEYFKLEHLHKFFETALQIYLFGIVVIFQPEIRRFLNVLGNTIALQYHAGKKKIDEEICEAILFLAENNIGALIAIEQNTGLGDYLRKQCVHLDAKVSRELITTIFIPHTPLHDGGVIIRNSRIAASCCFFPLSEKELPISLGTRHRSALGVSEVTDALVIVVSEEEGWVSICQKGKLAYRVSEKELRQKLAYALYKKKID